MTKQELLNNIVEITKQTGQGLSHIVTFKNSEIQDLLDILVKEGYITKHVVRYSHLPDDVWYMPKGCYNMWADGESMRALTFVRMYLGIDDLGVGAKISDFLTNIEFMSDYVNWLKKNSKELVKIKELKPILLKEENSHPFSSEELAAIKRHSFYKDNKNVKDVFETIDEAIKLNAEAISITSELLHLYKQKTEKYKKEYERDVKALEKYKTELSAFTKLKKFLNGKTGKIQKHLK